MTLVRVLDDKDRLGSLLVLAFTIPYLRYALVLPLDPLAGEETFSAATLPVGLAALAICLAFVQLLLSARGADERRISEAVRGFRWKPAMLLVVAMTAYALLFEVLGFALASFAFLVSAFLVLGERRLWLTVSVAAGLVLFLWAVLTLGFSLQLEAGAVARWLGSYLP